MCELIKTIQDCVDRNQMDALEVRKIQDAMQRFIPRLQEALKCCPREPGRYMLYKDPDRGFVVMMLVWGMGDETPIHAHGTWGVEAVVENHVRVTSYTYCEKDPQEIGSVVLPPGAVAYVLPPNADVHRVAQWGEKPSVTVHVYGKELLENIVFTEGRGFHPKAVTCRQLDIDLFKNDVSPSFPLSGACSAKLAL